MIHANHSTVRSFKCDAMNGITARILGFNLSNPYFFRKVPKRYIARLGKFPPSIYPFFGFGTKNVFILAPSPKGIREREREGGRERENLIHFIIHAIKLRKRQARRR